MAGREAVTRAAKLIWSSAPDASLLARADGVRTFTDLAAVARDLLADPRARAGIGAFYRWWLELDRLGGTTKDPVAYPWWSSILGAELGDATVRFAVVVTLDRDGFFATLMTAAVPFEPLVAAAMRDSGGDAQIRPGLLAQPGFLALRATPRQGSPVQRGAFIRARLLCQNLPLYPPGVPLDVPPPSPTTTNRMLYEQLVRDPACQGCHMLMNPIGYGLENYDSGGRYRTTDSGRPIDASGTIVGVPEGGATFAGAVELGGVLGSMATARGCMSRQWLRYALGRMEDQGDQPSLDAIGQAFSASRYNLRDLIVAVATSDSFLR